MIFHYCYIAELLFFKEEISRLIEIARGTNIHGRTRHKHSRGQQNFQQMFNSFHKSYISLIFFEYIEVFFALELLLIIEKCKQTFFCHEKATRKDAVLL